ncbi:MAG: DUF882 domain-containing protein [Mesorhizobium sp.]|nr:DUF882 domain-containing protein [Mesorhizobium sp.]
MLAVTCLFATAPLASAETRSLKLYYLHTREKAEIVYKKNGKFVPSGLAQLNNFLRDWRRNEPTKMDPRLFDLVWEVYRATGASGYINVVSAYRSPATNSMLRKRGRGVAQKSQHMLGKAMDFFIPGVKLKDLRYAGLRIQGGGVGFYPTSGSPFVHLDVGNVRHWPKMSRSELAAVFPDGKTMHVPSDGKPLPGYDQAVAAYQKRNGAGIAIASAASTKKSGGFLSALFGGGADEEEESGGMVAIASAAPQVMESTPVKPKATSAAAIPKIVDAPFPAAVPAPAEPPEKVETAEAIVAALPLRDVPAPMFAPRPSADVGPTVAAAAGAPPAPENIPFEVRNGEPAQIAEDVPIPMRRPDYAAPVAVAMASAPAANAIAAQPASPAGEVAIETVLGQNGQVVGDTAGIPVPVFRPQRPVVLASLDAGVSDDASGASSPGAAKGGRVAMLGQRPASPRDALRGEQTADPVAMLISGENTTPKSAKPSRADSRPDPKPISLPVSTEQVASVLADGAKVRRTQRPDGKAFAFNTLRSAPSEVYTAGFQPASGTPDPQRFTGKAVTFLSVAKFKTN